MDAQPLKRLYHCTYRLQYHLVIVTRHRRKCITKPMLSRLETIAQATTEKWEGEVLEFNGEPDHVHLLLELTPRTAPSAFVNNLKTVTSRLIRKEYAEHLKRYYWRKPVFWSRSYCIITVGGAPLSVLKQYIEQQGTPE
ncbi:IS200/IS605 family transposase [Halorhodospira halophila]|uniref:IS200/IS605 family transposase n=1 Tax=Halorhodospira halophila TaxID=1053 RepID=UPI0019147024|nr:IS200/IS605 family transposase [Halorhodospira halophila]MBK5935718.1 IS200/IS605 family transposase [Halorhodospira halophila]